MSNDNYLLKMGSLDTASGKPSNDSYTVGNTLGQIGINTKSNESTRIKAGFWFVKSKVPFSFSISQTAIDFGTLSATNPVTRTNNLTITSSSSYGYNILAYEDHPLSNVGSGITIPDTTCDSGQCTEILSSSWMNTLTYGFGFRCDNIIGTDCPSDFALHDFYRQFADNKSQEKPQTIMSGSTTKNNQVTITYKINISGSQAPGVYSNHIYYIAAPKY